MVKRCLQTWASALALVLFTGTALAQSGAEGALWENRHVTKHVKSYEGTKTCLECHDQEAADVFKSVHYQWKAAAPNISNANGRQIGKINATNDFCTNPSVSWIGIVTNDEGKVIGNGCAKCHVGLGKKPTQEMTQAQLENIDCLVCHANNYRREVVKKADGSLTWQPNALGNPAQMLSIAQNVGKPSNEVCMRCHVGSGGGLNFKRGDIETVHANADRTFDVHMGSNMQCIQCHKFKDHKVLGGGTQMGGKDSGEARPQCEGCHKGKVHSKPEYDKHASRVYCTTCHISSFARHDRTDMRRDWSHAEEVVGEGRFEPKIEFAKDVTPVYAWWNGTGKIAHLEEPVQTGANGKVSLYTPNGSRQDSKARIYAFKYHTARLPIEKATNLMVPVQVGPVFKTGKIEVGVKGGAKAWLGRDVGEIAWIETERYMGIFHEVEPKDKALVCKDCHEGGKRLDWKALGYARDPAIGKKIAKQ
ncbi:hypothetical protein [Propionivibrio dicarboxylicus]|uniref:Cytochrome c554 and c-prime n=1 Tax=Propionivibrio dicarboxylicus TaxID=83767 RepID=A0A1G8NBB9_9RHOO|nr:hypothetical protein [Propionivibrio dicarboxylicus]SDI77367.1 Cytochrome c554 and c-prime [Propionivibrio dicarboxylicus]